MCLDSLKRVQIVRFWLNYLLGRMVLSRGLKYASLFLLTYYLHSIDVYIRLGHQPTIGRNKLKPLKAIDQLDYAAEKILEAGGYIYTDPKADEQVKALLVKIEALRDYLGELVR